MEAAKLKNQEPVADILVVDDTMENLDVLVSMLSGYGYNVRPAASGEIALKAARSVPPDLVLLDIRMPEMDGYQVCQALKDDDRTRHIPIIFLTILDEPREKVKAFAAGAVDYITKPFQGDEVAARVEMHLRVQHLQKELQEQNSQLKLEIAERERAEEALNAARNELELRVEERTAELRDTNQQLLVEMAERKQAEEFVKSIGSEVPARSRKCQRDDRYNSGWKVCFFQSQRSGTLGVF